MSASVHLSSLSNDDDTEEPSDEIPVEIRDTNKNKHSKSTGIPIYGTVCLSGHSLVISFPLEGDYFIVTLTDSESFSNYWSTVAENADNIILPFDGTPGEYFLEIKTPDSTYCGYFTL